MIDGVTGNKRLPESVRHDIIERTDGIPLFVEEITEAVLEAENEGGYLPVGERSNFQTINHKASTEAMSGFADPARTATP